METPEHQGLDYATILRGIWRRRKRLVALIFLGLSVPSLAVVYYTSQPLYEAVGTIVAESPSIEQLPLLKEVTSRDNAATHLAVLESRSLAQEVIEAIPKESFEELLFHSQYTDYGLLLTNWIQDIVGKPVTVLSPRQRAIAELQKARMQFIPADPRQAPIITIKALASSPRVAMDLVNTHIQVLLDRGRRADRGDLRKLREFLEVQVRQAKKNMEQAEAGLAGFHQQQERVTLGSQMEFDLIKLSQAENALAELQASRQALEARADALRQMQAKGTSEVPAKRPSTQTLAELNSLKAAQERLAALEAKLASLQERYTDAHPLVQGTRAQLGNEQARLARLAKELPSLPTQGDGPETTPTTPLDRAEVQRQLVALQVEDAALQAQTNRLKAQVEQLRGKLPSLSQDEVQFGNLRRNLDASRNLVTVFSEKLLAARIREQGEMGNIRIIDAAALPLQPTQSKTQKIVLMVLVLAAGMAFGAAFGIEYWRQPIDTESDVQRATGLAVLGSVAVIESPASPLPIHLPSASVPAGIHVELYRAIRASIETDRLKTPFRSILVTSPGPSEGKSTTVLNLAHVFQEFGRRVLVVDADLRHPVLHRTLSVPNSPGLVDFLAGTASFEQTCRTLPSGVTVIPGQVARDDVASLLASSRVKELLDVANGHFDLILMDSVPLLAVPDNYLLVTSLDRVILVVKASSTSQSDLRRCQAVLQHVNAQILGVIVNQADPRDVPYYHSRFQKYYRAAEDKIAAAPPNDSARLS